MTDIQTPAAATDAVDRAAHRLLAAARTATRARRCAT